MPVAAFWQVAALTLLWLWTTTALALTVQTVDLGFGGPVGQYSSLTTVAGNPAAAYYNVADADLRFARSSNADGTGTWTNVTVDSAGNVGQGTSLEIVDGNPAIAYRDTSNGHLKFARNSAADGSGSWQISTIDASGNVSEYLSLVYLTSGRPAVAYYDQVNMDLKFARGSTSTGSGAWTLTTVSSSGDSGRFASLLLLANGLPAIAFQDGTSISFARNAAADGSGTWTKNTITPGTMTGLGFAVINGNPAIINTFPRIIQENFNRVQYVRNSASDGSGTWSRVDLGFFTSSPHLSMAEVGGLPAVAYDHRFVRASAVNGSGTWAGSTTTSTGNSGEYVSLHVVNGNPAITAFSTSFANGSDLVYARNANASGSGAWTEVMADDGATVLGGDLGQYATLAVISGNPGIAYFDILNGDVKFARNAAADGSGTWAISSPVTTGQVGDYTRLAVISSNPAIGFYNATTDNVAFTRNANAFGSGAWSTSNVESTSETGGLSIFEVSAAPALTYMARTANVARLRFARNSAANGSGTWTATTVDTLVANLATATTYFSSLGIVNGNPAVAYYHNDATALKFARNSAADGSGVWTASTVDDTGDVGRYASLAVVANTPAISYYDVTNTALKFARNSASDGSGAWTVVTVDNTGSTGEFTSLEVINGFPTISYHDQSNGDLKLARNSAADGSGTWTISTIDSSGIVGRHTSLKSLVGGYGIAYRDVTNTALKFAFDLSCAGISFPYTLVNATQANLATAIQCANDNGPGSDTINLNGLTVPLLTATPYGDYSGKTALPQITSNIVIRNGTLRHDLAGGGFLNRTFSVAASGTLSLEKVTLLGDEGPSPGGAIHNSGTTNITNCTFTGYSTSNQAGAILNATGATLNIANSLFYSNFAVFGHAIGSSGTVNIVNSTFDKHTSVSNFGAVLEGSGFNVRNSIIWNQNTAPTSITSGNNVRNSIVKGGYASGTNILNSDPLFVDRTNNDFHLQAGSPAINVGLDTDVPLDSTDVDGDSNTAEPRPDLDLNTRIVGAAVDAGAYERQITPLPNLSIANVTANEGNAGTTNFQFTVSLSAPAGNGGVSFDIATSDMSAQSGSDYVARALSSQTIPAGSSSYSFTVLVTGDLLNEPNEAFAVTISNVAGALPLDPSAVGTISNDDPLPQLSINNTSVSEGNSGTTNASFTVTLNAASGQVVTVSYATANDSATQPSDYTSTSGTLTFAANTTAQTITVPVIGDTNVEPDEQFFVNLSSPNNASVSDNQGQGQIIDDDNPCLSVIFPYTLPNNSPATLTQAIQCANANGTADVINLNNQTVSLSSSFVDSLGATGLPEITSEITLQNGTITRIGSNQFRLLSVASTGNLHLINMVLTNGYAVDAGATGGGGALLNRGVVDIVGSRLTGNFSALDGGAIMNMDSTLAASTTILSGNRVNSAAGGVGGAMANTSATATLTNVLISGNLASQGGGIYNNNDGLLTLNNCTVAGNLADQQGGGLRTENVFALIVLKNTVVSGNESPLTPSLADVSGLSINNFSFYGGSPAFVAPLDASNTAPTAGGDYRLGNLSPAIDAGSNAIIPSGVTLDLDGNPRRFNDTGVADTGAGGAPVVDMGAYEKQTNSAALPVLSINDVSIVEGNSGTSVLTFTVTRTGSATLSTNFSVATANDSAMGVADFVPTLGALSIPGGGTSATTTVGVTIQGDQFVEPNERFFLNISNPTNATIADGQGIGTIINDDSASITVSPANGLTTTEAGGTATFTVVLTSVPSANVVLTLSSSDSSEGTVFPSNLSFSSADWNVPKTVTITGQDDALDDGNIAYNIITAAATSSDSDYNGLNPSDVAVTNIDDDSAGISVSQSGGSTAVTEGGATDTFTVVLQSQPTANVSIAMNATQITLASSPLIFTPANWNVAQTVTVTAIDDNAAEGTANTHISFAVSSSDANYQGRVVPQLTVTITDNDSRGLTVVQSGGSTAVTEGGSTDSFTVVLDSQPLANVSLSYFGTQVSLAPTTLLFTPANWNVAQTVTVTAIDDNVIEGNHSGNINPIITSSDPGYQGLTMFSIPVAITDNDTAGISVVQSGGNTAVTEGGATDSFTVALQSQPSASVSVAVSGNQVAGSPTPLVFTTANWNVPQTVTVTAIDDSLVEGSHAGSIDLAATSSDANYQGLSVHAIAVAITDNDNAGISLVQSGGNTAVAEGGATDTFSVVLQSQPTDDVAVALSGTQVSVSPTALTFTQANWNIEQVVTVTAIDDAIVEGNHSGSISVAVSSSSDANYQGLSVPAITVAISDNDTAGLSVVQSAGTTAVTEAGTTDQFTVALQSQPAANVSVALTGTQVSVAPTPLIFTPANWNVAQTVTVTAIDDNVAEGNHNGSVSFTLTSADANYQGLSVAAMSVAITDNDSVGVSVVQSGGTTAVAEGGLTGSFSVTLQSQPTASVSIALSGSQVSASPAALTFTAANWNVAQTVTVTATDDNVAEGNHIGSISFAVTSGDANYQGLAISAIAVAIADNDNAGASVVESGGTTTATEGGATDTFTIVLQSQPTSSVSIALSSSQVSVVPTPLIFTAANWNVAQTVTVTAIDDSVVEGNHSGSISFAVTSSDANYQGLAVPALTVAITDNDSVGVNLAQSDGSTAVTEGGATDSLTVVLQSQPSANVSIALSGDQVTATPTPLTFTPSNWNVLQTVTISAINDNVVEAAHSGSVSLTVSSADASYNAISVPSVPVAVADNDTASIGFSPSAVSQSEASSPLTLTVTLSQPVASGVTVSVTSTPGSASTADFDALVAATVHFPPGSTSAQTVNVAIQNDALDEDDEQFTVTLSNLVATGSVSLSSATATATIQDDDALPTLSIAPASIVEGNSGTSTMNFEVSLSPASGRVVRFTPQTINGTASAATGDFVAINATPVTIPAGQTSVIVPVTINSDTTYEGNETFTLSLSALLNATSANPNALGTIIDDDPQPTTTTILSDLPDPTVTGQSYAVQVQVSGQVNAPTGTVMVSDGIASCTLTLATTTSPTSAGTCNLTSTSVGNKSLTATYVPDSAMFAASSDGDTHQVNAAQTTLTLTGPASSALNSAASYSIALTVAAPGAGTPAGTVTVQSGSQNCQIALPNANTSCAITFASAGPRTVSASFAPADANFAASAATPINTLVFAGSDLRVSKTNGVDSYRANDLLVYTIVLRNLGGADADGVRLVDSVPATLVNVSWTCTAAGSAICPAAGGVGSLDQIIPRVPVNGELIYTLSGTVNGAPESISNTASLQLPADGSVVAINPSNLTATDVDRLETNQLFADSFETSTNRIAGLQGSYRFPSAALAALLDATAVAVLNLGDQTSEAVRVYARVVDGKLEYALALRNEQRQLQLGPWQHFTHEPTLYWRSRQIGAGYALTDAELR